MSKKMMKRSLALGALMAFVITGSAMAAVPTNVTGATLAPNNRYYGVRLESDTEDATIGAASYVVDVQSDAANNGVFAFQLDSNGTKIKFDDNATFSAATNTSGTGNNQLTALSVYDGQVIVKGNVVATANATGANGKSAYGISVYGGGTATPIASFEGDSVTVTVTTETARNGVGTDYSEAAGVNVIEGTLITSENTDTTIDVTGTNTTQNAAPVYGVLAEAGSATFGGTTEITVTSAAASAYGVKVIDGYYTSSQSGDDSANASFNNVKITVENTNADGYAAGMYACERKVGNETSQIDVSGDAEITVKAGKEAYGVLAGWNGQGDATINLGKEDSVIKVNVTAKDATGIMARGQNNGSGAGSVMRVEGSLLDIDVTSTGSCAAAVFVANGTPNTNGIHYPDKTKMYINSTTTQIDAVGTGAEGIATMSDASLYVNSNITVNAETNAISTRGNAKTYINVDENGNAISDKITVLKGDILFDYSTSSGTGIDADVRISLNGEDSSFTGKIYKDAEAPVAKGTVTGMNISLSNGATWNVTGGSFVNTLNVNEGIIAFAKDDAHVDVDAGSGSVILTEKGKTADKLNTVSDLNSVAKKFGVKEDAKEIDATVVMAEGDVKGETTGVVTYDTEAGEDGYYHGLVTEVTEKVNTKNQAIGDAGISLKLHWRAHMNDMNKRMGELRNAEGEHGVWARMVRGESEYKNTKAQYNQYQLGYDEKLSVDKRWTVGAAVTFAEGDANYGQGSTEDKSTAFAIYGSKLNNDGTFVDLIARYAHNESDLDDANSGKGDYATNGMSVSAEFGKRIQQGNGLWIEPQVELTYGTVDSAEFQLGQKTVTVGDMDSLIGRVGFSLGKDIKQGNVYARASYLYDFDGETENAFSNGTDSRTIAEDLGGGWWEVGVGANINLSKATYVYADVEKTFGGEVDTNWQWNLGVRYSF